MARPLLMITLFFVLAANAAGHGMHVHAWLDGDRIQGRAVWHGGQPVVDARVTATPTVGYVLPETRTDQLGEFTIPLGQSAEPEDGWVVGVRLPDGHGGRTKVESSLPAGEETKMESPRSEGEGTVQESPVPADRGSNLEAIRMELVAIQGRLDQIEHRTRWSDLLGGIGYIVGLGGVAFYFLGRRA